ncbi:MAG: hypothetical protein WBQ75_09665 [Acetobacteraceae bacterium]
MNHLLRLHAQACRIAETALSHTGHPEVARALEQDVTWALINCLTNGEPVVRSRRVGMLCRFEELLAANPGRSPRVAEISGAIGMSAWTLRVCCSKSLGMPPGRYQRLKRLKRVRAERQRRQRNAAYEHGTMLEPD